MSRHTADENTQLMLDVYQDQDDFDYDAHYRWMLPAFLLFVMASLTGLMLTISDPVRILTFHYAGQNPPDLESHQSQCIDYYVYSLIMCGFIVMLGIIVIIGLNKKHGINYYVGLQTFVLLSQMAAIVIALFSNTTFARLSDDKADVMSVTNEGYELSNRFGCAKYLFAHHFAVWIITTCVLPSLGYFCLLYRFLFFCIRKCRCT